MLKIKNEDVKDYIDWIKAIITICSAAVATLLYKYDTTAGSSVKAAALLFVLSLLFFIISFTGLIEHKSHSSETVKYTTSITLIIGYALFIFGFAALVIRIF